MRKFEKEIVRVVFSVNDLECNEVAGAIAVYIKECIVENTVLKEEYTKGWSFCELDIICKKDNEVVVDIVVMNNELVDLFVEQLSENACNYLNIESIVREQKSLCLI